MTAVADKPVSSTTRDRFLGGLLSLDQPKAGAHRSGLDAILLAVSLPEGAHGTLIDVGSGVGAAGLSALALNPRLGVTLVDNDTDILCLAEKNAARFSAETPETAPVSVLQADATATGKARQSSGLVPQSADHVLTNPPYNDPDRSRISPHSGREAAHMLNDATLAAWLKTAVWLLKPKGVLTAIIRTERLPLAIEALIPALGGLCALPVHARADKPALRILLRGRMGSRAPFRLLPGLVLHGPSGSDCTAEAAALFEGRSRLSLE